LQRGHNSMSHCSLILTNERGSRVNSCMETAAPMAPHCRTPGTTQQKV